MKKVLIVMPSFSIGGISTSLYSLLSIIDTKRLEVDVFAKPTGFYKDKMPNCKVLPQNIWLSYPYIGGNFLIRIFQKVIYGLRFLFSKVGINIFPLIYWMGGKSLHSDKYDAVICFCEGIAYMVSCFPAKKKIQWIHCDYRRHLEINNPQFEQYAYNRYDTVVCVSEYGRSVFSDVYPEFAHKTVAIHDVIDVENIKKKAKEVNDLDERFTTDYFAIVSCGRLDPIKQFSIIPEIANKVRAMCEIKFRWYIIGGGFPEEANIIKDNISFYNIEDSVIMLGEKNNVFPYMAKADLFVCTSESETFSMVINEAKALRVPVISNNFPSAKESIKNKVDGIITPLTQMAETISSFMQNPMKIGEPEFNNKEIMESFVQIVSEH